MWVEVKMETEALRADALADAWLACGAISASVEDAHAGTDLETPQFGEPDGTGEALPTPMWERSRVIALFEPAADLSQRVSSAAGLTDASAITFTEIAEQDWVRLTQSQFDPICINEKLWIVPSWHLAPNPDATNLVLDPGLAFGTGSHPTTFLCLDWLTQLDCRGLRVLDYGCGSGILAIAAARLGANTVLGVDIDSNALIAAKTNAANNSVDLELRHSAQVLTETFDVVVANILTNPLCVLAPLLVHRVAIGGRIALSGVLLSQAELVIAAYLPYVSLSIGAERDGWVRLEGKRC
jgi:ribosomal protein L11 methyltransferase